MKNKIFLGACALVLGAISIASAHAAAATNKKTTYSNSPIRERYNHHFGGSGWNTPYHKIGVCYKDGLDPRDWTDVEYVGPNRDYNKVDFGYKYRIVVNNDKSSMKKFTVKVTGDQNNDSILANKYVYYPVPTITGTIDKDHRDVSYWFSAICVTTDYATLQCKKPWNATWSFDLDVTVYPFTEA